MISVLFLFCNSYYFLVNLIRRHAITSKYWLVYTISIFPPNQEQRTCNNNCLVGRDGRDGKDGRDGLHGRDGTDGIDGKSGKNGRNGRDGRDGKNGTNGQKGLDGKDGQNGIDGKDGRNGKDLVQNWKECAWKKLNDFTKAGFIKVRKRNISLSQML